MIYFKHMILTFTYLFIKLLVTVTNNDEKLSKNLNCSNFVENNDSYNCSHFKACRSSEFVFSKDNFVSCEWESKDISFTEN